MGNGQKPRCSSSMITAIPQFENFAIPLITHSTHGFFFFWGGVTNPAYVFLEIGRNYVSVTVTIISNITDYCCVSITQCYIP